MNAFTDYVRQQDRSTQVMSARAARHWRELAAGMAIVVTSAVCALDATAQKNPGPPNALQGFSQNRNEPVKIRAASLEVRVSPTPQLKRECSPWPEFDWIPGNPRYLSKG